MIDYDSYSDQLTRIRRITHFSTLERILGAFSPGERLALYTFTIVLGISALAILGGINTAVSISVPARGGSLTEGAVGPARFINPLLAISQPDEDLTALIYSGLIRVLPNGEIVPDLASRYSISPDGSTYTFILRDNATFHDGKPVTSADVLFTVRAAQNPDIKSPHRADWEGVSISAPDPHTVVFELPHAYAPFIENAALGILPAHIWNDVLPAEFPFDPANTRPVGSGPYRIEDVVTDSTGSAVRYDLIPFRDFTLGKPHLSRITFMFFPNQDDAIKTFNAGRIDALAGIAPEDLKKLARTDSVVARIALPRVFGVFFNQNRAPILADSAVRAALESAIDKRHIVESILGGYGIVLDGPIPPSITGAIAPPSLMPLSSAIGATTTTKASQSAANRARAILQNGGWNFDQSNQWTKSAGKGKQKQMLSFTLATADEPELVATARALAEEWRAAGITVTVQIYPLSELNTNVIRPRAYDAILFGEVIGHSVDLFAFWHSSQRNDPGLNLALYANSNVDTILQEARASVDPQQREKLHTQFTSIIQKDKPAIFLYAPEFIYVLPQSLHGVELGALATPAERFLNVYQWYTDTERVWSFFAAP